MPIHVNGNPDPQPLGWEKEEAVTSKPRIGLDKMCFSFKPIDEASMEVEVRSLTHPDMYNIQQSFLDQNNKHLKMLVTEKGYATSIVAPKQMLVMRPAQKRTSGGLETMQEGKGSPPSSLRKISEISR